MKDLDLSAIGLVIDDRDPQAIFDAIAAKWAELAPTSRLANGSLEAILFEASAVAAADVIYAANREISGTVQGVLDRWDVPRYQGAVASGTVLLTLNASRTLTVGAGQRLEDPATGLILVTTASTSVTAQTSITVPVATEEFGAAGNALVAGTPLNVADAIPYVSSVQIASDLTGGAEPETDATYLDRMSTYLARVSSALSMPIHFRAFALGDPRVGRARELDNTIPSGAEGADPGHITVYVYGHGAQVSSDDREDLRALMYEQSMALLTPHVEPAGIVTQAITLTVHALIGYDHTALADAVEAALDAWLSPDNEDREWGRDILPTEIIEIAGAVPGVDYVDSVTTPAAPVTVAINELGDAGTISVTVT